MRYKIVLWDFDGTLADTLGGLLRIYNNLAVEHGFRLVSDPDAVRNFSVLPFLRSHNVPLRKVPSLIRAILAAQRSEMDSARLFPDLLTVLQAMHAVGCRMSILSSNARENILACLRANGVEELFEAVVGYRRLFGKGSGIRRFLKQQRFAAEEVIYIGDEVRDVEAAQTAGVDMAAVTWGLNTPDTLAASKPTYLIERPAQLRELLS